VQYLINAKWLSFVDDGPNVKSNPLPGHGRPSVNAIEGTIEHTWRKSVEDIKTPLKVFFKEMCKFGLIEGSFNDNHACSLYLSIDHAIEDCSDFKQILQDLMDRNFVQIGCVGNNDVAAIDDSIPTFPKPLVIHYTKGVANLTPDGPRPITIKIPKPFPYKDNKAVPWRYNVEVCTDNAEENHVKDDSLEIPGVTNIVGIGGMTRSGRIYTSADLGVKQSKEIVKDKEGGKELVNQETTIDKVVKEKKGQKKEVSEEEAYEFLKMIKQSEYIVIDQLNHIPAKISFLSLMMNSELHKKTLLKFLNEAHVVNNLSVEKF